ncbi:hypothetical protein VIGAN_07007900, partial [Vigna angularis var. angularis]
VFESILLYCTLFHLFYLNLISKRNKKMAKFNFLGLLSFSTLSPILVQIFSCAMHASILPLASTQQSRVGAVAGSNH